MSKNTYSTFNYKRLASGGEALKALLRKGFRLVYERTACLLGLRCRQRDIRLLTKNASQEVSRMTTLEIRQEVEDVQKRLNELDWLAETVSQRLQVSQENRASLEEQFKAVSNIAELGDETTRLQRLADEIKEFIQERKFYQLEQVLGVTVDEAIKFIECFRSPIPVEVFDAITAGIESRQKSLKLLLSTSKRLSLISEISKDSTDKELQRCASNLEIFAEEIEDNLPFLSAEVFSQLETFFEAIVLEFRRKGEDAKSKRESCRRRIRFAAGFILDLVEITREEAIEEDEEILRSMQSLSRKTLSEIYREDEED